MSYLSLARKYRPGNFDEVIGQEHITTTLKNAVTLDRVAHAYLFAGPRGVGKTSTARILAKSLNCEKGPTQTPCNECPSCQGISRGISMDVIEIDGASNRGIDEIRNLRESIKFASVGGKFRIYIIDEVHMLTQEAFNALLKTLEEPPLHVKFIFATTRPYKVLPTIISRCQRFDFRKIPTQDITKKLKEIKEKEKLDLNDEAIFLIAKASDGSMRDGEIILDQLLSFTKGKIKSSDVVNMLGLLEQDILFDLTDSIINNEKNKVLNIINDFISGGKDPIFIATSTIDHFRNLMVAKVTKEGEKPYVSLSEEDYYRLQEQARKFSLDEILYVTYSLSAAIDLIKKTTLGRIPLEITLVKLTERKKFLSIKEILERLALIEKRLKSEPHLAEAGFAPGDPKLQKFSPIPISPTAKTPLVAKEEVAAEKDILLLQKIKSSWAKVLNFIKSKKMSVATFLSEGQLVKVKDNVLVVGFDKANVLHKEALETNANKGFVEDAIRNIIGENMSLNIENIETEPEEETELEREGEKINETVPETTKKIDPIVESAIDIFDGRIVDQRDARRRERR